MLKHDFQAIYHFKLKIIIFSLSHFLKGFSDSFTFQKCILLHTSQL